MAFSPAFEEVVDRSQRAAIVLWSGVFLLAALKFATLPETPTVDGEPTEMHRLVWWSLVGVLYLVSFGCPFLLVRRPAVFEQLRRPSSVPDFLKGLRGKRLVARQQQLDAFHPKELALLHVTGRGALCFSIQLLCNTLLVIAAAAPANWLGLVAVSKSLIALTSLLNLWAFPRTKGLASAAAKHVAERAAVAA